MDIKITNIKSSGTINEMIREIKQHLAY